MERICGPGFYVTRTSTCSRCPPGTYSDMNMASSCLLVPIGYFNPYSGSTNYSLPCPRAVYSGSAYCTQDNGDCSTGRYFKSGFCESVPKGYYNTPQDTGVYYFCSPSAESIPECSLQNQHNYHFDLLSTAVSRIHTSSTCVTYGYYVSGGSCAQCPAGYYCPDLINQYVCPAGKYSSAGVVQCSTCTAGKYNPLTAQVSSSVCLQCSSGTYSVTGASQCTNCPLGYYGSSAGVCTITPTGSAVISTGLTAYSSCSYAVTAGAITCNSPCANSLNVPAGYYNNVCNKYATQLGSYNPSASSASSSATTNNAQQYACPAGYYSATTGQTACSLCPQGYYSNGGASACSECTNGLCSITPGLSDCTSICNAPSTQPTSEPSRQPSSQPSRRPSIQPSVQPVSHPTGQPSRQPSSQPSLQPSKQPTNQPSEQPTSHPTRQPTGDPTGQPTSQPSNQPTEQPSFQPMRNPTAQPSSQPTMQPSRKPSQQPSSQPSPRPSRQPSSIPSTQPSLQPNSQPTSIPTLQPTRQPTSQPTLQPSAQPTSQPSSQPTSQPVRRPTTQPSSRPSRTPTSQPTMQPTSQPTSQPSIQPTSQPTRQPTGQPTRQPTSQPTGQPTNQPSRIPTMQPSVQPTSRPTMQPSKLPSMQPSEMPSMQPTSRPSRQPTQQPSRQPSRQPTSQPSLQPTRRPSLQPTVQPSRKPSAQPSKQPSSLPTVQPTQHPTLQPSMHPSTQPSVQPTRLPTRQPSSQPSNRPTDQPTMQPTDQPSARPTMCPTMQPSSQPTRQPTRQPSTQPIKSPTSQPSKQPNRTPSRQPTSQPTRRPSSQPTKQPIHQPSGQPSRQPIYQPSCQPSSQPSRNPSMQPSSQPSMLPSAQPSQQPLNIPSVQPTSMPSAQPTSIPTAQPVFAPSVIPTIEPSLQPVIQPSCQPVSYPTAQPSRQPTMQPSVQPTAQPTRQPLKVPTGQPTSQPSSQPSLQPFRRPSGQPSRQPTKQPLRQPTSQPTQVPSVQPSRQPWVRPSQQPTAQPFAQPSQQPVTSPTCQPTGQPSSQPSIQPTMRPTAQPSRQPSNQPTKQPLSRPSMQPTRQPSSQPVRAPTSQPTRAPSDRPTLKPSNQPSGQPSARPVPPPTAQPTIQPSQQPSSHPSLQPTNQPTRQPSKQPSAQPSRQPVHKPTSQPTSQPSLQPLSQPTSQPSSQPMKQPVHQPSRQPSTQPSAQPSHHPSHQPTTVPTSQPHSTPSTQPTVQPIGQPTSQPSTRPTFSPSGYPSVRPSVQPSSQPTDDPSAQPSESPSVQPSTLPTSQPSTQPSKSPLVQPTSQPSTKPTKQPIRRPSSQPSGQPRSQPSSMPSGQPSRQPTSQPTAQPSNKPTRQPSRRPSRQPSRQPSCQPSVAPSNHPTSVPTVCPSGKPTFYPTHQPTYSPSNQPQNAPTSQPSHHPSHQPTEQPTSVPSESPSTQPSSRPTGQPTDHPTTQPTGVPTLQPTENPSRTPTSQPSQQPRSPPSAQPSSQPTTQPFSFPTQKPVASVYIPKHPPPVLSIDVSPQPRVLIVSVRLKFNGLVHCGAFLQPPVSNEQIFIANVANWSMSNVSTLTVTSLIPSTQYFVYCLTESIDKLLSPTFSSTVAFTTCCKNVFTTLTMRSAIVNSFLPNALVISVEDLPSGLMTIIPSVIELTVDGGTASPSLPAASGEISATSSFFYPQNITLDSSSLSRSISFGLRGLPRTGVYLLNISLLTTTNEFSLSPPAAPMTVTVLSSAASEPPTPEALLAQFSSDGSFVSLSFDGRTNGGGPLFASGMFNCPAILLFANAHLCGCQWSADARTLNVYPGYGVLLKSNDGIIVLGGRIRAHCPLQGDVASACLRWNATLNTTLMLVGPDYPTPPTVVITAPTIIGECDDLTLDWSASSGHGGRDWATFSVSVVSLAPNRSYVEEALNKNGRSFYPVQVPKKFLNPGFQYSIVVTLCNFLGSCGQSRANVRVSREIVPFLTIPGPTYYSIKRDINFSLVSSAVLNECSGRSATLEFLQYSWNISKTSDGEITSISAASVSSDPMRFLLPSFSLQAGTTYKVVLTVTYTLTGTFSTATVNILVDPGAVVAAIRGGATQTMRLLSSNMLDASISRDEDQPNNENAGLNYRWVCAPSTPTWWDACALSFNATEALKSSQLIVFANSSSLNSSSVVTVIVSEGQRASSASVAVVVVPADSAVASIVSSLLGLTVNPNYPTVLTGYLHFISSAAVAIMWDLDTPSVNLPSISTSSVTQSFTPSDLPTTILMHLVLPPHSLPPGTSLTFSLRCTYQTGAAVTLAALTVTTTAAPRPGSFSVTPKQGYAILTSFTLVTFAWSSDALPLQYQFGFITAAMGSFATVRSLSLSPSAVSYLPPGRESLGFQLLTTVMAFDAVGANASLFCSVTVRSSTLNASTLELLMNASTVSVDATKQLVSAVGSIINIANCSLAPNCLKLLRSPCSVVDHTCGPCLASSSIVGAPGSSNEACVRVTAESSSPPSLGKVHTHGSLLDALSPVTSSKVAIDPALALSPIESGGGRCDYDSDCKAAWELCSPATRRCYLPSKRCPQDCSDSGKCYFVSTSSNAVLPECKAGSVLCTAVCDCDSAHFGPACAVGEADLITKQSIRTALLSRLERLFSLENADIASVAYWSDALAMLSIVEYEIANSTIGTVANMTRTILNSASSFGLPFSSTVALQQPLSTVVGQQPFSSFKSILDSYAALAAGTLVSGQVAVDIVMPNFRQSSVASTQQAPSIVTASKQFLRLTIPSTPLERYSNRALAKIAIPNEMLYVNDISYFSASLMNPIPSLASLNGSASGHTEPVLASNSLRWQYNSVNLRPQTPSGTGTTAEVVFTIPHLEIAPAINNPASATVQCTIGVVAAVSYQCANQANKTIQCNGLDTYTVHIGCPQQVIQHTCSIVQQYSFSVGHSNGQWACVTLNSSDYLHTDCSCSFIAVKRMQHRWLGILWPPLSLPSATSVTSFMGLNPAASGSQTHTLAATVTASASAASAASSSAAVAATTSASSGILEVVSLSSYFVTSIQSFVILANTFDVRIPTRSTQWVSVSFLVFWLVLIAAKASMDILAWDLSKGDGSLVRALIVSTENSLSKLSKHVNGIGDKNSHDKAASNSVGQSNSKPSETHAAVSTRSSPLLDYLYAIFPPEFSEEPWPTRLKRELLHRHNLVGIFELQAVSDEGPARSWTQLLRYLTVATFSFFMMAYLFKDEYSQNDSQCRLVQSKEICEALRSPLNVDEGACQWKLVPTCYSPFATPSSPQSTSSSFHGECEYAPHHFNARTFVLFTFLVQLIAIPLQIVLELCTRILTAKTHPAAPVEEVHRMIHEAYTAAKSALIGIHQSPQRWEQPSARSHLRSSIRSRVWSVIHGLIIARTSWPKPSAVSLRDDLNTSRNRLVAILDKSPEMMMSLASIVRLSRALSAHETFHATDAHDRSASDLNAHEDSIANPTADDATREVTLASASVPASVSVGTGRGEAMVDGPTIDEDDSSVPEILRKESETFLRSFHQFRLSLEDEEELREFDFIWNDVLDSSVWTTAEVTETALVIDDEARIQIETLLEDVNEATAKQIELMKSSSAAEAGATLLKLFLMDLLGRGSGPALLLNSMIESTVVPETTVHAFTQTAVFSIIMGWNICFVFLSIQFATGKSYLWQKAWLSNCSLWLTMDLLFSCLDICFFHGLLPEILAAHVARLKLELQALASAIEEEQPPASLVVVNTHSDNTDSNSAAAGGNTVGRSDSMYPTTFAESQFCSAYFSASHYFFVSSRLAKLRPDIFESSIVLSYISMVPVQDAELFGRPDTMAGRRIWQSSPLVVYLVQSSRKAMIWSLEQMGSWPRFTQRIILELVLAVLFVILGSLFAEMLRSTAAAAVLSILIFYVAFYAAWYIRRRLKKHKKALAIKIHPLAIIEEEDSMVLEGVEEERGGEKIGISQDHSFGWRYDAPAPPAATRLPSQNTNTNTRQNRQNKPFRQDKLFKSPKRFPSSKDFYGGGSPGSGSRAGTRLADNNNWSPLEKGEVSPSMNRRRAARSTPEQDQDFDQLDWDALAAISSRATTPAKAELKSWPGDDDADERDEEDLLLDALTSKALKKTLMSINNVPDDDDNDVDGVEVDVDFGEFEGGSSSDTDDDPDALLYRSPSVSSQSSAGDADETMMKEGVAAYIEYAEEDEGDERDATGDDEEESELSLKSVSSRSSIKSSSAHSQAGKKKTAKIKKKKRKIGSLKVSRHVAGCSPPGDFTGTTAVPTGKIVGAIGPLGGLDLRASPSAASVASQRRQSREAPLNRVGSAASRRSGRGGLNTALRASSARSVSGDASGAGRGSAGSSTRGGSGVLLSRTDVPVLRKLE